MADLPTKLHCNLCDQDVGVEGAAFHKGDKCSALTLIFDQHGIARGPERDLLWAAALFGLRLMEEPPKAPDLVKAGRERLADRALQFAANEPMFVTRKYHNQELNRIEREAKYIVRRALVVDNLQHLEIAVPTNRHPLDYLETVDLDVGVVRRLSRLLKTLQKWVEP
jgi:hypothetical protein